MNNANEPVGIEAGLSTLVRPRFGPGMLLQHEDLEQLTTYMRDLSRLLFKSFFGCGVVCGLVVKGETKCERVQVTVSPGVGLACSGDPVQVPAEKTVVLKQDYAPVLGSKLWVVLCGTTKCCAPRNSICASDDDEATAECTREKDGFEIRVMTERPPCVCGCPEEDPEYATAWEKDCKCVNPNLACYADHYAGKCECNCDECSDCDCKCILLARLDRVGDTDGWLAHHKFRRFIRPVLMRDPQVAPQQQPGPTTPTPQGQRVEQAAQEAAAQSVMRAAEQAAEQAAYKAAHQVALEVGQQAANEVVKQVVEQVRREAEQKALQDTSEQTPFPAAPPAVHDVNDAQAMPTDQSSTSAKTPAKKRPSKIKTGLNNS